MWVRSISCLAILASAVMSVVVYSDAVEPKVEKKMLVSPYQGVIVQPDVQIVSYQGRIEYIGLEGGFFGIVTEKGERLLPVNLAKEDAKSGAIINIKAYKNKNTMTLQQWGTPVTLTELTVIKEASKLEK